MSVDLDPRTAAYVAALAALAPLTYGVSTGSHAGYTSAASVLAIAAALYVGLGPSEAESTTG